MGQEQPIMPSVNSRDSALLKSCAMAAVLGLSVPGTTSHAQNYDATSAGTEGDAALASRIKQALHSDKALDDRHVDVAVAHGEVVLNGFVQDSRELLVAGEVAAKAAGSHKIVNRLLIKQNTADAP
jgi:osmotically-inducible protein OsmY